jgi:hypothetical protein
VPVSVQQVALPKEPISPVYKLFCIQLGSVCADPTTNGSAAGTTAKVLKEGEKPSTIPIQSECVSVDITEVSKQPIRVVSAISEAVVNEFSNPNNASAINEAGVVELSNLNNKTISSDPTPNASVAGHTTEILKEGEKPTTILISRGCELVNTREMSSVTSAVGEDNGNESSNSNNRMSTRRTKIPPTRDDFLWG